MFTIGEDQVGRHDFTLTPCRPETSQILYRQFDYQPSCFENLSKNLAPFGIRPDQIPTRLNIFMNVGFDPWAGKMTIGSPLSRPGQYLDLRAEMVLSVGLTACSAELSNAWAFKPLDAAVYA